MTTPSNFDAESVENIFVIPLKQDTPGPATRRKIPEAWGPSSSCNPNQVPLDDYSSSRKSVVKKKPAFRRRKSKTSVNYLQGQDETPRDQGGSNQSAKRKWWNRKIWWWNPQGENILCDFFRETSMHGLKYIGENNRHLSERIFWVLSFLGGVFLAMFLIKDVWMKYTSSPIIVSFQSSRTTIDEIPFAAQTICNTNKVLKSKALEYLSPDGNPEDAYYVRHVCGKGTTLSKSFNFTDAAEDQCPTVRQQLEKPVCPSETKNWTRITEFLQRATQKCWEMIPYCRWKGSVIKNCSEIFRPVETEYGKCCTFNRIPSSLLNPLRDDERDDEKEIEEWKKWNVEKDGFLLDKSNKNEFPRRQMQAGKHHGLSYVLDPGLDEYFCSSSDSDGFIIFTHLPTDTSHAKDLGTRVPLRGEVTIKVKPEITVADDTVYNFPVRVRECYRPGEYRLKYFNYYTIGNCIEECIANLTMQHCGCKRYYMPRGQTEPLCGADVTGFNCVEAVIKNITDVGSRNSCNMCLDSCLEIQYDTVSAVSPLKKTIKLNDGTDQSLADRRASFVHSFYPEDSIYPRLRKEYFGLTDLLASFGGILGLCLGLSGLSFAEIIYFITLRAFWIFIRKQMETSSNKGLVDDNGGNQQEPRPPVIFSNQKVDEEAEI